MARQLIQLLLVILTALGILSFLGFNAILSDIEQNEDANQKHLLTDISTQINLSYELLDKLLIQKKQNYQALHQFARSQFRKTDGRPDLSVVQKILELKVGFPVDLYIINADLMVTDSTFAPDLGLNFKLPPFLDVQQFLDKARQTSQIMVGQPNMEFISKQFKIYTYSVLDDNRYLELGFIDSDINGYFQRLIGYLSDRDDARITLFIEYWNKILSPMSVTPESTTVDKLLLFKQLAISTKTDRQAFRHVTSTSIPYQTRTSDTQGRKLSHYYIKLPGLSNAIIDELAVRYLVKITFDDHKISMLKERFQLFLLLSVMLSVTGMLSLAFYIRRWLIGPINQILAAIEQKLPVSHPQLTGGAHEIRKIAVTFNDTLEHLKQSMSKLERQSTIDPLTGLDNRRKFTRSFDREVSRARRNCLTLALVMIDIDHFKNHNDRYGHQQGDELLSELARQMKSRFLRPSDHLCRMGGDEFSVLLIDIDPSTILSVFESLQQDWTRQYYENLPEINASDELPVSISIGIYVFDSSLAPTWGAAYQRADAALYTAKDKGRNRVVMVREDTPKPDDTL
ncbi:MAG: diguanylate cyclase [Gammaproteobacteria bacterium]|nr:diguanylate cyclase [Gammaproteobacteria bacterium]